MLPNKRLNLGAPKNALPHRRRFSTVFYFYGKIHRLKMKFNETSAVHEYLTLGVHSLLE